MVAKALQGGLLLLERWDQQQIYNSNYDNYWSPINYHNSGSNFTPNQWNVSSINQAYRIILSSISGMEGSYWPYKINFLIQ